MSPTAIGLVGGIASGKSAIAALFLEERPGILVDADELARGVRARPDIQRALLARFDTMDPARLATLVFSDPAALRDLERITHPPILRAIEQAVEAEKKKGGRGGSERAGERLLVLDAPLLLETGLDELCDIVVYVACDARERRRRARTRSWTEEQHRAREARQWSCRRKRAHADAVVDNRGDSERARRDVRRILRRLETE